MYPVTCVRRRTEQKSSCLLNRAIYADERPKIYIWTHSHAFLYVLGVYIIYIIIYLLCGAAHADDASTFFNSFFFYIRFVPFTARRTHIGRCDLKTFSGYLGVDLADTKGPQKVICHPLLTRFIRQQKSRKKNKIIKGDGVVKMHLDGLWDIWRAAVFLYIFLDPSKIDCRHRHRLYQYSYVFFFALPRFCVYPLIDATSILLI